MAVTRDAIHAISEKFQSRESPLCDKLSSQCIAIPLLEFVKWNGREQMSDKSHDPLAVIAAHEDEMDKLFSEMGLPQLDLEMDEAAAVAAFEAKLPPIIKASMIEAIAERHAAVRALVVDGANGGFTNEVQILYEYRELHGV